MICIKNPGKLKKPLNFERIVKVKHPDYQLFNELVSKKGVYIGVDYQQLTQVRFLIMLIMNMFHNVPECSAQKWNTIWTGNLFSPCANAAQAQSKEIYKRSGLCWKISRIFYLYGIKQI